MKSSNTSKNERSKVEPTIVRWVDLDSPEFQKVEKPSFQRKIILGGVELGVYQVDKAGYLWCKDKPVFIELGDEVVGLRYSAKAVN